MVNRRLAAWLLSVPLMIGGTEAAHWLVFRLVYPDEHTRMQVLAGSGHSYLKYWVTWIAILAALGLTGFAARAFGPRARNSGALSLAPFLALAPLAFTLQECSEQIGHGAWPFAAAFAPTFLPGLLLQLPFALLTYLLARALLRVADAVLAARRRIWVGRPAAAVRPPFHGITARRPSVPGRGWGLRGPPQTAA